MDEVPRVFVISPPLEMNGRVYASSVRSSMPYGSETRPLLHMIRWMCGISVKNRSEELRSLVGVEPITESDRRRWYEHVMKRNDENWSIDLKVEDQERHG